MKATVKELQDDNSSQNNDFEKQDIDILMQALKVGCATGIVQKDQLSTSLCCLSGMKLWSTVLKTNVFHGIEHLKLEWCAIESKGAILLSDGLMHSCLPTLKTLNLIGNEICVSGTRSIAGLLAPGIDLDKYETKDQRNIIGSFDYVDKKYKSHLKTLILSHNCILDAGCDYLGKAISLNNTINTIELENCEIGDYGMKYLRRGIERNTSIETLNIAANRFGDLGAREIQSFLVRNNSLIKLDISRNRLGPQRTMEIAKGLTFNDSVKILRANINRIGARGMPFFARVLLNNNTIEELELSHNEIFNDGVQVISQGIIQNHSLKRVVLWRNGLEDFAVQTLARALQHRMENNSYFRNNMIESIAEAQANYFFLQDKSGIPRQHPQNYKICEKIVDFLPIFMYFQADITHNRRITSSGLTPLIQLSNSQTFAVRGLNFDNLLSTDRKQRESSASTKTSLY